jgi:hypothetical protein
LRLQLADHPPRCGIILDHEAIAWQISPGVRFSQEHSSAALVVEKEGLLVRHAGQDQQYHGAVCPTDLTQEVIVDLIHLD